MSTTNILFLDGFMTQERWQQLESVLRKQGWIGRLFIAQSQGGVISGKWSFELVETPVREGLTAQQSALLDTLEAGNQIKVATGTATARDLDTLVDLGLCGRLVDGSTSTYFAGNTAITGDAPTVATDEPPSGDPG